jgi:large exoprotein involved in heme utilization and adhesion
VPEGWTFDYGSIANFRNVQLTQKAFLSTTGVGGGSVQIQGAQVRITNGSAIFANTLGAVNGGTVLLQSTDLIEVSSTPENDAFASRILANVQPGATGNGGSLQLKTHRLLFDLAVIHANTFGSGNSGGALIQSPDVQITNSYVGAGVNSADPDVDIGNGGNLTIQAERVRVLSTRPEAYSLISTSTFGSGQGGNLTIQATESVQITAQGGYGSFLTGTGGGGMGGRMLIETGTLQVQGYTGIDMAAIDVGNSGSLTLNVNTLKLTDGGFIDISTYSAGNAGTARINAQTVEINGAFNSELPTGLIGGFVPSPSGIYVNTAPDTTGDGGRLIFNVDRLLLSSGGTITANTRGSGTGGTVSVQAQTVEVRDYFLDGLGTRSGIISSVDSANGVTGGDLTFVTQSLRVLDGGFISSATNGTGNAGNIFIKAQTVEIAGTSPDDTVPSQIIAASTSEGRAGSIEVTADRLSLRDNAKIVVSGQGVGDAGNLWINAGQVQLDTGAKLRAEASSGSQGNISLSAKLLLLRRNTAITTSASDRADGGNITINAQTIAGFENSDIIANAVQGRGGNIQITTQGIFGLKSRPQLTPENDITASSQFGLSGIVQVNTIGVDPSNGLIELPVNLTDSSRQIVAGCADNQGSQFVITGRGGIPDNPAQVLRSDRTWADTRDLSALRAVAPTAPAPTPTELTVVPLIQATGWRRNPQTGNVELYAENRTTTAPSTAAATCAGVRP